MTSLQSEKETRHRQDLIEQVLMAGFLAGATGSFLPGMVAGMCPIFSQITSAVGAARMVFLH
jgi:hypothetical protein